MKKKVLLKAPILTRSGYGEQARFAFRSLMSRPDLFDVYVQPLQWGHTSWLNDINEERKTIDHLIEKTIMHVHEGGQFDMSLQVTIPNEWEKLAPVNIGYTAGIETTKVAPQWLEKGNYMDKIIVVSDHSKRVYQNTAYTAIHEETKEEFPYKLVTDIESVNYPVKTFDEVPDLNIDLDYDVNFLSIAQWGARKNMENTVRWFVEEFLNDEVGLVVKSNFAKNCLMDKIQMEGTLKQLLAEYKDRTCKVYLLHGDMSDEEIHALYVHPQIKAFVGLPHGEGFGLPFFEAAYSGMPVIATGWSGQLDFLFDENMKEHFYNVAFDIQQVQKEVVWDGVLVADSMWAFPREASAKEKMRQCYDDIIGGNTDQYAEYATELQKRFSQEKMYDKFVSNVWKPSSEEIANMDLDALKDSADLAANIGLL
ncbi:hypothetical protein CMI37_00810 [Candidatus Pacearchaeota archaeon]|nr:hypothetical protein [Candidatus Pacearchaeota archaeon]